MPATSTKAERPETADEASVFVYDTENSPNVITTWGVYEQNALEILKHRQIITVAWKWLGRVPNGEKQSGVVSLPDFQMYKKDRENNVELIRHILAKMEKADIVIGHNAGQFDNKRVNTDIVKHRMTPPPPHKVIDTLRIARKYFGFNQNSLKALAEFLGVPHKIVTGGYPLWKACMSGDLKAWAKMSRYCYGDIVTAEAVYLRLRPWDQAHPALRPRETNKNPPCPLCHERKLVSRGTAISRKGRVPRAQCRSCGHWPPLVWMKKAWRVK